jgi:hypothetical protein
MAMVLAMVGEAVQSGEAGVPIPRVLVEVERAVPLEVRLGTVAATEQFSSTTSAKT